MPDERLVVTIGFSKTEIEADQKDSSLSWSGEPIIIRDPNAKTQHCAPSASFINKTPLVTCRDVTSQLRKSIIRVSLRKSIEIRPPSSDAELSGYFSLRYQILKSLGFLRDINKRSRIKWEVDFWDRTALPLCAVNTDGKVIGCARLVQSHGTEQPTYVAKIQQLLDSSNDPVLRDLFKYPNAAQHPFDLLLEFPGFGPHFKALLEEKKRMAEIGRVAVHKDYRGRSLSEAIVDTAVSFAESKRVSCLFLACRMELIALYEKCGFKAAEGIRSETFFNIKLPSVVMVNNDLRAKKG